MITEITEEKLVSFFKKNIAAEAGIKENEIDLGVSIEAFNLDSLSLVSLSHELDTYLGSNIDPTVFWEFSTINDLIKWILENKK